ncbi:hypothetical protein ACFOZ5_12045 [Marinobacter lacisalsi]|uniref:Uncharacterized protein n=1 Tax=Marinobacter lacisalsi TaxID=475979 RepID=A0ABV8QHF6_9GAMM
MESSFSAFQQSLKNFNLPEFLGDWSQAPVCVPFLRKQPEGLLLPAARETPNGHAFLIFSNKERAAAEMEHFKPTKNSQVVLRTVALGEVARNAYMDGMKLAWHHEKDLGLITDEVVRILGSCASFADSNGQRRNYWCTPYRLNVDRLAGQGALIQSWLMVDINEDGSERESSELKVYDDRKFQMSSEDEGSLPRSSLTKREQALFDRWATPSYFDGYSRHRVSNGLTGYPEKSPAVSARDHAARLRESGVQSQQRNEGESALLPLAGLFFGIVAVTLVASFIIYSG